jgi:uncharacterized protein (TIGR03437 family)
MKSFWALTAFALAALPLVLWSNSGGAIARSTGAPGDNTCLRGGCHVGTQTANSPTLEIVTETNNTYTPGARQRITVRIGDPGRRYGFQATVRLDSNLSSGQAGTLTNIDQTTYVLCEFVDPRPAAGCPASSPLEFITHLEPRTTNTFQFDWTAPATNVGPVTIFVAANSSDGPGQNGAKIHLKSLRLQPAGAPPAPTINPGGVISASAFGGGVNVAPGSWIEIFGQNFTNNVTRTWTGNDFNGAIAPKNLDGVEVFIDGKAAPVAFIAPSQVNAQVPDGIPSGAPVEVRVKTPNGESSPVTLTGRTRAPGILAPANFSRNNRRYVAALFPDGVTFAAPPDLVPGVPMRLPKPGDTVIIYGVGFGATNPATPTGMIVSGTPQVSSVTIRIGPQTANAAYAGLAPGFVGLYQFNVVVPNLEPGEYEIVMTVDGTSTQPQLFIAVGN